jgi:hypothetical protein
MREIVAVILLFVCVSAHSQPAEDSNIIKPSERVAALVEPILEGELVARQHDSEATEFELGGRLQKLFEDQSPIADESFAVILNYYVGEANDGNILHQITVRGKRMLPILLKYRGKTVVFDHESKFAELKLPLRTRQQNFATAIDFIRKGKIWGTD